MTAIKTRRSAFKRDSDQNATVGVQNFERPFTPRGWLRSASNFAKTCFRRFLTFHFSKSKKLFDNFFSKNFSIFGILAFWRWRQNFEHDLFVLEELEYFEPHWHILHAKWPRLAKSSSLYVPWRRGWRTIEVFSSVILDQNWLSVFALNPNP